MRRAWDGAILHEGVVKMKSRHKSTQTQRPSDSTKAKAPAQKAKDSPEMDVYHDDNRRNMYDPEVGDALKQHDPKKRRDE